MFRQWSEMFRQQSSRQLKIQTTQLHYYRGDLRILNQFCSLTLYTD